MYSPTIPLMLGIVAIAIPSAALADVPTNGSVPPSDALPIAPATPTITPSAPALLASAAEAASNPEIASSIAPDQQMPVVAASDSATVPAQNPVSAIDPQAIALNFDPPHSALPPAVPDPRPSAPLSPSSAAAISSQDLFAGGSDSIVGRTVGAAEGTRTPDGDKTDLYYGHVDPGNGVWNRGTFSYQFGNAENLSQEEADRRQMAKIKRIYDSVMLAKAQQQGVAPLTLSEELNGIDLINQAPLAVTEAGGYIERLAEAKAKKGLSGDKAILEARVWAFWDPQRDGWDAPGLRAYDDVNKEASIRHDQERRMGMIAEAMTAYQKKTGTPDVADQIIFKNLSN